jgi:hypothetical protein
MPERTKVRKKTKRYTLFLTALKVDEVGQLLAYRKKIYNAKDQIWSLARTGKSVDELGSTIGLRILVSGMYKEVLLRLIY